jgi:hypothetical protein
MSSGKRKEMSLTISELGNRASHQRLKIQNLRFALTDVHISSTASVLISCFSSSFTLLSNDCFFFCCQTEQTHCAHKMSNVGRGSVLALFDVCDAALLPCKHGRRILAKTGLPNVVFFLDKLFFALRLGGCGWIDEERTC